MKTLIAAASLMTAMIDAGIAQDMEYGEAEFLNSCAACHGLDAKGTGPLSERLIERPADLTTLGQRNGGKFPYDRVVAIIDGRYVVPGHGDRDMPVWGREFLEQDAQDFGKADGEIISEARIHELAQYLQTLQR